MYRIIERKLKIRFKKDKVKRRPLLILLGQRLLNFFLNHYTLWEQEPKSLLVWPKIMKWNVNQSAFCKDRYQYWPYRSILSLYTSEYLNILLYLLHMEIIKV